MKDAINPKDEVLQAEREWLEAHRQLDLAALNRLMHADYTQIKPDGAVCLGAGGGGVADGQRSVYRN